jgi:hypothetical protein
LGPFEGFTSWTTARETTRVAVNNSIRSEYDRVADFDAVLRNPNATKRLRPSSTRATTCIPTTSGASALVDSLPLWWL